MSPREIPNYVRKGNVYPNGYNTWGCSLKINGSEVKLNLVFSTAGEARNIMKKLNEQFNIVMKGSTLLV